MILYRTTHIDFGTTDKIFCGLGAAKYSGRWNVSDMPCIYTSLAISTAAAERAKNSLLLPMSAYNSKQSLGLKFPVSTYADVVDQQFKLATVNFKQEEGLIDLTSEANLQAQLELFRMPMKTLQEARINTSNREKWTKNLGKRLSDSGALGAVVLSARSNQSNNVILFDNNITSDMYEIEDIFDFLVSAVSVTGSKLKNGQTICEDRVLYECPAQSDVTDVLFF